MILGSNSMDKPGQYQQVETIGFFEKWLSIWVGLCIITGIFLGNLFPDIFQFLALLEYASVYLVVVILIWVMIYPMMINIDFSSFKNVGERPKGLIITLVVNWLVKPFSMAALGVLFFEYVFVDIVNPQDAQQYIAGLILLGAAPCTAMVFVWSQLTKGDPVYTVVQVTINDLIMVFAFAPIVAFLLGVTEIVVPWETLILSVVLYIVVPIIAGAVTRKIILGSLSQEREDALSKFSANIKPYSIIGLMATVLLLFAFQAPTIIEDPMRIGIIAVPIVVQSYGIFFIAYFASWLWRVPHCVAAPSALIGTSNFFELAVAVAISLFGLSSGAALATVVGVLVEVPVMLSLVTIANKTRHKFPK
ncbi:MAG: ACR3 family arsenite efflux transporter [Emcibacteraceae bacterium]|nr:ACR3 family arsenite efflux transporter [Emcibacteraceae bacterium]